jgi:hypothetical protein
MRRTNFNGDHREHGAMAAASANERSAANRTKQGKACRKRQGKAGCAGLALAFLRQPPGQQGNEHEVVDAAKISAA